MKKFISSAYLVLFNSLSIFFLIFSMYNTVLFEMTRSSTYIFRCAICQSFFLFEILNVIIGASGSTIIPTTLQLFSRVYIIWYIIYLHKINTILVTLLLFVWNLSDLVRFLFYLFRTGIFRKLRYNAFLILYPIGILLEIYLINSIYMMHDDMIGYLIGGTILLYLPSFPYLYYHMIRHRRRSNKIFEMKVRKNL